MSVFEDLIGDLKNENLLEETVIDLGTFETAKGDLDLLSIEGSAVVAEKADEPELLEIDPVSEGRLREDDVPQIEKPQNPREFFRKRAMEEVASLQMVEHLFNGVEREYMKAVPVTFDDLAAKKALHKFLQVSEDIRSPEHAESEFELRNETEAWNFALYERDKNISVANIRRFCEESRPVLSNQAMIALARFYRNSPFSEDVRAKFDYVMTRLFSRETDDNKRHLLFEDDTRVEHIATLYDNWSSIALYSAEDDKERVDEAVSAFESFTREIESAETFDELLRSEYFDRTKAFKEECAELYYVPKVLASGIICNIAIGNRYIKLIERERASHDIETIEQKYGYTYDQIVSDAAGRTLLLVDLLQLAEEERRRFQERAANAVTFDLGAQTKHQESNEVKRAGFFGINRWLLAFCVVFIMLGGGVYLWAERYAGGLDTTAPAAVPVQIDDADVQKHLTKVRTTKESLYAVAGPSYDVLTPDEKKNLLVKVHTLAKDFKVSKVNIMNKEGRTIAFASDGRLEIIGQ